MTRYEKARENPREMSIMTAFCIAAYLRRLGYRELDDEENLKGFMYETSEDIEEWLGGEDA